MTLLMLLLISGLLLTSIPLLTTVLLMHIRTTKSTIMAPITSTMLSCVLLLLRVQGEGWRYCRTSPHEGEPSPWDEEWHPHGPSKQLIYLASRGVDGRVCWKLLFCSASRVPKRQTGSGRLVVVCWYPH